MGTVERQIHVAYLPYLPYLPYLLKNFSENQAGGDLPYLSYLAYPVLYKGFSSTPPLFTNS